MAVGNVLLDTNAYAAYKKGDKGVLDILKSAERIVLSSIVLGELRAGFALGNREEKNLRELDLFLVFPTVRTISLNEDTSIYFAKVFSQLRTQGTPIPTNDMWIAASAFQYGLKVLSYDKHFQQIRELELLNPKLA